MSELCRLRRSEGYEARDDEEQEKAPALLLRRCGHNRPQCGRLQRRKLTLFCGLTSLIDADSLKSGYIKPGGGAGHYAEHIGTRGGVELLNASDQYLKYIAERPLSHGLFSSVQNTDLEKAMQEVNSHPAPVWTFIYSLRREDAARLGYDSAESGRKLLLAHQTNWRRR